jgi:multicomponent Na+:H+ antiporter subunit C
MEIVVALVSGGLFSVGFYLLLRRNLMKIILGIAVLSNAVNLVIFGSAGLTRDGGVFVPEGASAPVEPFADPLAQAFILTAIVISLGMLAFAAVLAIRVFRDIGLDDTDEMRSSDQ